MTYQRMRTVAFTSFLLCAGVLGFLTAWFDLAEGPSMLIGAMYLLGGLPGVLYLHFIAKANPRPSKHQE